MAQKEEEDKFFFKSFKLHFFLKANVEVLSNIVTYLPSLTSSINARPAFFCIEFCHSCKKKKIIYICIYIKLVV